MATNWKFGIDRPENAMKATVKVGKALRAGKTQASRVLRQRATQLRTRAAAAKAIAKRPRKKVLAAALPPKAMKAAGAPAAAGVLIAEGDSWFDYPRKDILNILEDRYAFDVESVAHAGDRVEAMAYSDGQLSEFTRRLEKLLRRGVVPRAILLSGGGNDIAGDEFAVLLNHALSPIAGISESVVTGVIDERISYAYITILSATTEVCERIIGQRIPIVTHGYDYPVPDGRGFGGGFWILPGPWLEPGFNVKGFANLRDNIATMKALIDRFNTMLKRLTSLPEFSHVTFVDLRGTLMTGASYKDDWANELHPSQTGFERVAAKIAAAV